MLIPLSRQVNFMELHLSVTHEFIEGVELVGIEIKNFFDPGVYQNLKTVDAGSVGNVDRRILYARPVLGGLRDRVHFSVDGAKTVLFSVAVGCFRFVNQAAHVGAMGHAGGRAIVSSCENILVTGDHGADFGTGAGRPLGHLQGDRHEILIPAQPIAHNAPGFLVLDRNTHFITDFRGGSVSGTILINCDFQQAPTIKQTDELADAGARVVVYHAAQRAAG
jgi:hypothetical protein